MQREGGRDGGDWGARKEKARKGEANRGEQKAE